MNSASKSGGFERELGRKMARSSERRRMIRSFAVALGLIAIPFTIAGFLFVILWLLYAIAGVI